MVKITREAALTEASVQAHMLTTAPTEISTPIKGKWATSAKSLKGATLLSNGLGSPRNPRVAVYEQITKKIPLISALISTARGMKTKGRFASAPNAVALS